MKNVLFPDVYKLNNDKINIYELYVNDKKYYSFSKKYDDWGITIVICRLFNIELNEFHNIITNCNGFQDTHGICLFNEYDDANAAATMLTLMRRE